MLFHSFGTGQTVLLKMNPLYLVEQIKTVYPLGYSTDGVYSRYGDRDGSRSFHKARHSSDEKSLALNTLVNRFRPLVLKSLHHLGFYLYFFSGSWFYSLLFASFQNKFKRKL